jgi:hypothetical protein
MTWLIPSAMGIAAAASLLTIALHFIARSRPVAEVFPTARFIPDRAIHARTRSLALTDTLLLLLRVLAIMLLGVAVAGPLFAAGSRVTRIVIADRSRAVANIASVRDSVRAYLRSGDELIVFDSVAHLAGPTALDSFAVSGVRGSLSAALTAGIRAAVRLAPRTDSIEMVLVSPLVDDETDEATARIRATWPGRIRVARVANATTPPTSGALEVRAPANDAVAAGLSLVAMSVPSSPVRVVRSRMTGEDSVWARGNGHVLVHWPASDTSAEWAHRASIDAIGGVSANGVTLIARFPRLWSLKGRAIARWADGESAAVENVTGDGCIRDVAVLVDDPSDVTLRVPFRRFASELLVPCGGRRSARLLSEARVASLVGNGGLASARAITDATTASSRWTPWLMVLAAVVLITELAIRRTARVAA